MNRIAMALLLLAALGIAFPASAFPEREDAIWARAASSSIVLDGQLNESSWARAESIVVRYAYDTGIPGSGWKAEAGVQATDSTYAVLKFLTWQNQLYLGAKVHDRSVGGSREFNRFDGLLMAVKDHLDPNFPKPPAEYMYAWWYPESTDPQPPGQSPAFIGRWAAWPPGTERTPEQIEAWDARTIVHGLSNSDGTLDTGYTVEMRFNLTPMGYDILQSGGDVVEWNISIYDCDWFWPFQPQQMSTNRVWWQSPWGNAAWYNEVRIHANPAVTVNSGPVPQLGPEMVVPLASADPVIDGDISDAAWDDAVEFDIRYGDDALRFTYPGVGPWRAGQYQPPVNGGEAFVFDPADATVKMMYRGSKLYFAFETRDLVVQYHPNFDRWDGFLVSLNELDERGPDNNLLGRRLSFQIGQDGNAVAHDYLLTLVQGGFAQVATEAKAGTTIDTLGQDADTGFTAELSIDLTQFGYPSDAAEQSLFAGVTLLDGDSAIPFTDSYGTRTWWFREYENNCCPVWGYLGTATTGIEELPPQMLEVRDVRAFPNPGSRTNLAYRLDQPREAFLEIYDVSGRLVERRGLGIQQTGEQVVPVDGTSMPAGIYLYRLLLTDPDGQATQRVLDGRLVIVR